MADLQEVTPKTATKMENRAGTKANLTEVKIEEDGKTKKSRLNE